jgi:hypothetical protein
MSRIKTIAFVVRVRLTQRYSILLIASTPQGDAGPVDPIAKRLPELRECHTSGEK